MSLQLLPVPPHPRCQREPCMPQAMFRGPRGGRPAGPWGLSLLLLLGDTPLPAGSIWLHSPQMGDPQETYMRAEPALLKMGIVLLPIPGWLVITDKRVSTEPSFRGKEADITAGDTAPPGGTPRCRWRALRFWALPV